MPDTSNSQPCLLQTIYDITKIHTELPTEDSAIQFLSKELLNLYSIYSQDNNSEKINWKILDDIHEIHPNALTKTLENKNNPKLKKIFCKYAHRSIETLKKKTQPYCIKLLLVHGADELTNTEYINLLPVIYQNNSKLKAFLALLKNDIHHVKEFLGFLDNKKEDTAKITAIIYKSLNNSSLQLAHVKDISKSLLSPNMIKHLVVYAYKNKIDTNNIFTIIKKHHGTWKAALFKMAHTCYKFAINSSLHSLPTVIKSSLTVLFSLFISLLWTSNSSCIPLINYFLSRHLTATILTSGFMLGIEPLLVFLSCIIRKHINRNNKTKNTNAFPDIKNTFSNIKTQDWVNATAVNIILTGIILAYLGYLSPVISGLIAIQQAIYSIDIICFSLALSIPCLVHCYILPVDKKNRSSLPAYTQDNLKSRIRKGYIQANAYQNSNQPTGDNSTQATEQVPNPDLRIIIPTTPTASHSPR